MAHTSLVLLPAVSKGSSSFTTVPIVRAYRVALGIGGRKASGREARLEEQ